MSDFFPPGCTGNSDLGEYLSLYPIYSPYTNYIVQIMFFEKINRLFFAHLDRYQTDISNQNLITRVQELASAKEVWFRAAVIAVPIAGGLILVLLIMLALRMLRSENKRLRAQRQQMLSRLHYSFHGHHHAKKGHVAKLDLECMVPVTGHENCCTGCDKLRQAELSGRGGDRLLSLVHWGMYTGHGKLEFVWLLLNWTLLWDGSQSARQRMLDLHFCCNINIICNVIISYL